MKTALLVIDMQNDYLGEGRKKIFSYDTAALTASVNALIRRYAPQDVVYIRHIIHNLPTNRLLFGYSIAGTQGAELYGGLDIVSDLCFDKYVGDALTNRALRRHIREKRYDMLHLCGLDECGCVTATALGAAQRGLNAAILRSGTATVFPEKKVSAAHAKLARAGIAFL
jgi:Amidases related to nicotinamidase